MYAQRPVTEKHNKYAFYHQSAEAIAGFILDLPYKTINMFSFNLIVYFLPHLNREPGAFFFFCLATYLALLVMSCIYRTVASFTRTSHQAMIPAAIITVGVMIYSGFAIPPLYMRGWAKWMRYINPLAYSFEALMANEFHGRNFQCAKMIPFGGAYSSLPPELQICTVVGAVAGSSTVNGDDYIEGSYEYFDSHKWR